MTSLGCLRTSSSLGTYPSRPAHGAAAVQAAEVVEVITGKGFLVVAWIQNKAGCALAGGQMASRAADAFSSRPLARRAHGR